MMIITIDGPAGTGKTTVAQKIAHCLNLPYFDTGAMYRAVSYLILHQKIPLSDEARIKKLLDNFQFEIKVYGSSTSYFANGIDVTDVIRSPAVTNIVSPVSALSPVREALWKIQRRFGKKRGGVFEGRDMGSVVFPKSNFKIFLTARPEIRAKRRLKELQEKRPEDAKNKTEEQMVEELTRRDALDSSRMIAPLQCPKDAYIVDTSDLTLDEVVDRILEYIQKKTSLPSWIQMKKMALIYRFVLFFTWVLYKVFYRMKIYGLEHFYPRGAILAANHTSFLDPPIIAVSWPEEVHFVARQTLFKGSFGSFIRKLNAHPVSGNMRDAQMIKTMTSVLEKGGKVVLFPEGTRSEDGQMAPFKSGVALFAVHARAAIIPVYIDGAYRIWGRKKKFPCIFGKIRIVYGSAITWESVAHLEREEAKKQLTDRAEKAVRSLKEWLHTGAQGIPP